MCECDDDDYDTERAWGIDLTNPPPPLNSPPGRWGFVQGSAALTWIPFDLNEPSTKGSWLEWVDGNLLLKAIGLAKLVLSAADWLRHLAVRAQRIAELQGPALNGWRKRKRAPLGALRLS